MERLTKTCIPPLCKILKIRNEFHGGGNVGKGQSYATEASYEEIKSGNATGWGFSFLMSQNRLYKSSCLKDHQLAQMWGRRFPRCHSKFHRFYTTVYKCNEIKLMIHISLAFYKDKDNDKRIYVNSRSSNDSSLWRAILEKLHFHLWPDASDIIKLRLFVPSIYTVSSRISFQMF